MTKDYINSKVKRDSRVKNSNHSDENNFLRKRQQQIYRYDFYRKEEEYLNYYYTELTNILKKLKTCIARL
jgi:hypothetical protein